MKKPPSEKAPSRVPFSENMSRFFDPALCTFQLFPPPVPQFVEQEVERLYENVYCTIDRMRVYGFDGDAYTFISKYEGNITDIFIFRIRGAMASVLNQQITVPEYRIRYFVDTVLSLFLRLKVVSFYAIDVEINNTWRLFNKWESIHENVVTLPASRAEFDQRLSSSFRYSIRSSTRKLQTDFPSFTIRFYSESEISEKDARAIIALTAQRMAIKGKSGYLKEADIERIMRVLKLYGMLCVASINGKICGGNLWYAVGKRHMMHIISHDPCYDRYALGNYLNYETFIYCIERSGKECWLMGGNDAHKAKFGAIPFNLYSYRFYRSPRYIIRYFFDNFTVLTMSLWNKVFYKTAVLLRGLLR